MSAKMGVSGLQRLAIRVVGRFPGISAGEIAELLHVHPSTLTGVFQKLLRKGLIARSADPKDARRSLFLLTAHGKKIDQAKSDTIEASVRRALSKMPPAMIETAREALTILINEIEVDWSVAEAAKTPQKKRR